jgi:hypothetical protein
VRMEVRLADGSTLTLPIVEGGWFLGSLPRGVEIERLTAYDDSGNAAATSIRRPG